MVAATGDLSRNHGSTWPLCGKKKKGTVLLLWTGGIVPNVLPPTRSYPSQPMCGVEIVKPVSFKGEKMRPRRDSSSLANRLRFKTPGVWELAKKKKTTSSNSRLSCRLHLPFPSSGASPSLPSSARSSSLDRLEDPRGTATAQCHNIGTFLSRRLCSEFFFFQKSVYQLSLGTDTFDTAVDFACFRLIDSTRTGK